MAGIGNHPQSSEHLLRAAAPICEVDLSNCLATKVAAMVLPRLARALCLGLALFAGTAMGVRADQITVFAAASLRNALDADCRRVRNRQRT